MLRRAIVGRARERAARLAWLEQAAAADGASAPDRFTADGRPLTDGNTAGYQAKVPADHPDYQAKVAVPVMNAVDAMPQQFRTAVAEFDYVDVYRAWRRGWSVEKIRDVAARNGGRFVL